MLTKKYYSLTLSAWMVVVTIVLVLAFAAWAQAASLKICFGDASINADTVQVRVFADSAVLYSDILNGAFVEGAKRCNVKPIPASMVRGVNLQITLVGVNAFEEVGPASNAIAFRPPLTPQSVTGATLSVIVP